MGGGRPVWPSGLPTTSNPPTKDAALKHCFTKAVEWGYVKSTPAAEVKLFKETPKAPRFLTAEEIDALLAECPPYMYPIVVVAVNTGMRRLELFNLQWEDVDFQRGIITVRNRGNFRTKNAEDRTIPMNATLTETLRGLPRHIRSPYVFPSIASEEGKPYNILQRGFQAALRRTGIGHVRFHDLRHTFASHLVMSGVDLASVQRLLGHKDIGTTMRYSHLAPDHLKGAVDKLELSVWHKSGTNSRKAQK